MKALVIVMLLALGAVACGASDEPPVDGGDGPSGPGSDGRVADWGEVAVGDAADVPAVLDGPGGSVTPDALALACGVSGAPCCEGNRCEGGGCCVVGRCSGAGESCGLGTTCTGGSCGGCGGPDQPCCKGTFCTAPATACRMGTCKTCGGVDQPCCNVRRPCTVSQATCDFGFEGGNCRACGAIGADSLSRLDVRRRWLLLGRQMSAGGDSVRPAGDLQRGRLFGLWRSRATLLRQWAGLPVRLPVYQRRLRGLRGHRTAML